MTIDDKAMEQAFAILDFAKFVDEEYLSVCLEALAGSVTNPIKRHQIEEAMKLVIRMEVESKLEGAD